MRLVPRAALALACIALVAGCGSSRPRIPPLPEIKQAPQIAAQWSTPVGRAGRGAFAPVLVDGTIYAAGEDGYVSRIDPSNGRVIWSVRAGRDLSAGVGADARRVVVGTVEGEVIALDADGKPLWRQRVSSEVQAPPLVVDDLVVVRSADARVFGLEAADGKRRWVFQRTPPALVVRTPAGAVAQRGLIYAGFAGGRLAAISASNGGLRWESTVSIPRGATELERVSDVVGLPWLSDREVCAVAFQGRAACFDSNTGNALWARDFSSRTGLGGDARVVFSGDEKGGVVAMDRSTGASLWRQDQLVGRALSPPLAAGRVIVIADMQGYVHFLARDTGALVARAGTDSTPIVVAPILLPSGAILVQTTGGRLVALAPPVL